MVIGVRFGEDFAHLAVGLLSLLRPALAEGIIAEPKVFPSERLPKAGLFKAGNLLGAHEIDFCASPEPRVLLNDDEGHRLLVFSLYCGVGNSFEKRVVFFAGQPPPAAKQHIGKRMAFVPRLGQLLHLAQNVPVYGLKPAFVVFELPQPKLGDLFHHTLHQRIVVFFVHCTQPLSNSFSAVVKLPFYRTLGNTHSACDFRDRESFKVMQPDDLSYSLRQLSDAFVQFVSFFGQCVQLGGVLPLPVVEGQVFQGFKRQIAAKAPYHIQGAVFRNTAHPSAEFPAVLQGVQFHPCGDKGVLRRILRHMLIVRYGNGRGHHRPLMADDKGFIRALFSGQRQHDQRFIAFVSVNDVRPPFAELENFRFCKRLSYRRELNRKGWVGKELFF